MNPIVVLTGGTGFIGQKLGLALVRAGCDVRVIARDPSRHEKQMAYPCELFAWQNSSVSVPKEALQDAHAVIHLAGESIAAGRWTKERKQSIVDSRVQSSEALVKAIQSMQKPPSVFVQSSAIGFYGDAGDTELTETSPAGDDFLATTCVLWEKPSQALDAEKTRVVAIRTGLVLGWEGGALPTLNNVYTAQLGAVMGSGQQWQSWIHIDDLINLYMHALKDGRARGPINGVAPTPVRFKELHTELGIRTGGHAAKSIPTAALNVVLGEQSRLFLNSQKVSAQKALSLGFNFRFKTLHDALDNLFKPVQEKGARVLSTHQWVAASEAVARGRASAPQQTPPGLTYWQHTSTITPLAGGVLVSDFVQYKPPLSRWLHGMTGFLAQKNLKRMFQERSALISRG